MDAEQCSIDLDHDGDGINDQLVAFNAAWEFVATQLSAPAIKSHATARRSASLTKLERRQSAVPPYAFKQSVRQPPPKRKPRISPSAAVWRFRSNAKHLLLDQNKADILPTSRGASLVVRQFELAAGKVGRGYRRASTEARQRGVVGRTARRCAVGVYVEGFNTRLCDELLDGERFYTPRAAQIVIGSWRRNYNAVRPHPHKPPALEVFVPALAAWPAARTQTAPTATLPLAPRPPLN